MSRVVQAASPSGSRTFSPWVIMLVALGLVLLGLVLAGSESSAKDPLVVGCVVVGLITAGSAVARRLKTGFVNLEARFDSACLIAGATLVTFIAYLAFHSRQNWDSFELLLLVGVGVGAVGAVLVLLPWNLRKWVISFGVLFHFGGVLSAVTSVPAGSGSFPWLANIMWTRVFRSYLLFTYMNNAYHFYSPDPGPPILIWFRVQYEDDTARWVQLAKRSDFRTRLEYQRFLALTESVNHVQSNTPINFARLVEARNAHRLDYPSPLPRTDQIPHALQYREPVEYSKRMLVSYVRHVARAPEYRHPDKPEMAIKSVKVYRVIHTILMGPDMAAGTSPIDPTVYQPYFQGEFDPDGKLQKPDDLTLDQDPFLYWLLPCFYVQKGWDPVTGSVINPKPGEFELFDCLSIHAGDNNWDPYKK